MLTDLTPDMLAAGWHPHDGGPCPVPLDGRPGVMFRDGQIIDVGVRTASYHISGYWSHYPGFPDREHIIAYKLETENDV